MGPPALPAPPESKCRKVMKNKTFVVSLKQFWGNPTNQIFGKLQLVAACFLNMVIFELAALKIVGCSACNRSNFLLVDDLWMQQLCRRTVKICWVGFSTGGEHYMRCIQFLLGFSTAFWARLICCSTPSFSVMTSPNCFSSTRLNFSPATSHSDLQVVGKQSYFGYFPDRLPKSGKRSFQ